MKDTVNMVLSVISVIVGGLCVYFIWLLPTETDKPEPRKVAIEFIMQNPWERRYYVDPTCVDGQFYADSLVETFTGVKIKVNDVWHGFACDHIIYIDRGTDPKNWIEQEY